MVHRSNVAKHSNDQVDAIGLTKKKTQIFSTAWMFTRELLTKLIEAVGVATIII